MELSGSSELGLTAVAPHGMRRLSLVRSPDGAVHLVADADGDEPPEPRYAWQAHSGT